MYASAVRSGNADGVTNLQKQTLPSKQILSFDDRLQLVKSKFIPPEAEQVFDPRPWVGALKQHTAETQKIELEFEEFLLRRNLEHAYLQACASEFIRTQKSLEVIEREGHACSVCHKTFNDKLQLDTHYKEIHVVKLQKSLARRGQYLLFAKQKAYKALLRESEDELVELAARHFAGLAALRQRERRSSEDRLRNNQMRSKNWVDIEFPEDIEVDEDLEEPLSTDTGISVSLLLGPQQSGQVRIHGLSPVTRIEEVKTEVGKAIGLRKHMIALMESSSGSILPPNLRLGELPESANMVASLHLPPGDLEDTGDPIQIYGIHSSKNAVRVPMNFEPQCLPALLCEQLGIDVEMGSAWSAFHSERMGTVWCFLPTKSLIANSGWSKAQVRTQLIRGGIESNPGPGTKRGRPPGKKFSPTGTLDLATIQTHAGSMSDPNPIETTTPELVKEAKGFPLTSVVRPPAACGKTHLDRYLSLLHRPTFRKLSFPQLPGWKDVCQNICAGFDSSTLSGKEAKAWRLLSAVKRYLFLPVEKLTQRQFAKELRLRSTQAEPEYIKKRCDLGSQHGDPTTRALRFLKVGAIGKAARALDTKERKPLTREQAKAVAEHLHPRGPKMESDSDAVPRADVKIEAIKEANRRQARGSAPGPSGWTKELLFPLLEDREVNHCLLWIINGIVENSLPSDLREALTTSKLILIRKSDEEQTLPPCRPIALGELFVKPAGSFVTQAISHLLPNHFRGTQYGVGTAHDCHHVNSRRDFSADPSNVLMSVDVANAFDCLYRDSIRSALKSGAKFKPLLGYFFFCYTMPGRLILPHQDTVASTRGVRQGGSLWRTTFLFSIGIQQILDDTVRRFANRVKLKAYLDDVTLLGAPEHVRDAFSFLSNSLSKVGLKINKAKCQVSTHQAEQFSAFKDTEITHSYDGQKLLGAYVARDPVLEQKWVEGQVPKMQRFVDKLASLPLASVC